MDSSSFFNFFSSFFFFFFSTPVYKLIQILKFPVQLRLPELQTLPADKSQRHYAIDRLQYQSRELSQKFGGDKHVLVSTNMCLSRQNTSFVATKVCLSRQNSVCRYKHTLVATKDVLCRVRHVLVATKAYFCREERRVCRDRTFVATKIILVAASANDTGGSRKERALEDPPWKDEKGPSSVGQTNSGTVSKATLGRRLRDGMERIWAFLSAQIASWIELNLSTLPWEETLFFGLGCLCGVRYDLVLNSTFLLCAEKEHNSFGLGCLCEVFRNFHLSMAQAVSCRSSPRVTNTLHWLPVESRTQYNWTIEQPNPSYLSDLIQLYVPSHQLRSSADIRLLRPLTSSLLVDKPSSVKYHYSGTIN